MTDRIGIEVDPVKGLDRVEKDLDTLFKAVASLATTSDAIFNKWAANTSGDFNYVKTQAQVMVDGVNRSFLKLKDGATAAIDITGGLRKALKQSYNLSIADAARYGQDLSDLQIAQYAAEGVTLTKHHRDRLQMAKAAAAAETNVKLAAIKMQEELDKLANASRLTEQLAATKMQEELDKSAYQKKMAQALAFDKARDAQFKASMSAQMSEQIAANKMQEELDKTAYQRKMSQALAYDKARDAQFKASQASRMADQLAAIKMQEELDKAAFTRRALSDPSNVGPNRSTFETAMLGRASSISGPLAGQLLDSSATAKLQADLNKQLADTPAKAAAAGASLRKLALDGNDVHSAMRGLASGFNLLWLTWGNLLPLFAGAAISNSFVQVVKQGAEVANTLKTIEVLGENTTAQMGALNDELIRMTKSGPFGPQEIAEAMKVLSLAGLEANKILAVTQTVLNFSVSGTTDIKTAADTLMTVSTAFNMGAEGFGRVADVITVAAASSKTSVESFSNAMKTASVINAQYGVSLVDTATAIATMSQLGIEGTAAGTALRNMYADLSGRTKQVAAALQSVGLETRTSTGAFKPMLEVVGELSAKLQNMSGISQKNFLQAILSERGAKGMIEMLRLVTEQTGKTGADLTNTLAKMQSDIENSFGASAIAAAKMGQTVRMQWEGVKATFAGDAVSAFSAIEPELLKITYALKELGNSPEFMDGLKAMAGAVASFIVTLVEAASWIVKNGELIVTLAAVYAGLRIATTLTANAVGLYTASTTAATAASAANTAATIAETAALQRKSAVSGGLAASTLALARFIPMVGTAVMVAAGAWELYQWWSNASKDSAQEMAGKVSNDLIRSLEEQGLKLAAINELRRTGLSLADAEARLAADKAGKEAKAPLETEIANAEKRLAAAEKTHNEYAGKGAMYANSKLAEDMLAKVGQARSDLVKARTANAQYELELFNKTKFLQNQTREAERISMENRAKAEEAYGPRTGSVDWKMPGSEKKSPGQSQLENLMTSMEKFRATTAEMASQESKVTEAEKYRIGVLTELQELLKNKAISQDKYNELAAQASKDEGARVLEERKGTTETLTAAMMKLNGEMEVSISTHAKLTPVEKLELEMQKQLQEGTLALVDGQEEYLAVLLAVLKGKEKTVALDKEQVKASQDLAQAREEAQVYLKTQQEQAKVSTELEASRGAALSRGPMALARLEAEQAVLSKAQPTVVRLTEAVRKLEAAKKKTLETGGVVTEEELTNLTEANKELHDLKGSVAELAAEAGANAVKKKLEEKKDAIAGGLADAVITGLENGAESGLAAMRKVLIDAFIKEPLRVEAKLFFKEAVGGIMSFLGMGSGSGSGAGGGAAGSGNPLSSLNSLSNLYSTGSSMYTVGSQYLGGTMSGANAMGTIYGNATTTGQYTALEGLLQTNGAYGTAAGATPAVGGATGAAPSSSGFGAAAGAAMVFAVIAILASRDATRVRSTGDSNSVYDPFGNVASRTNNRYEDGGGYTAVMVDGRTQESVDTENEATAARRKADLTEFDTKANDYVDGLQKMYQASAKSLGLGTVATAFSFGSNDSSGGKFRLSSFAGDSTYDSGEIAMDQASMRLAANRAVLSALAGSTLPTYLEGMFDGVDISGMSQEDMDKLINLGVAVKGFHSAVSGVALNNLTNANFTAIEAMAEASGGIGQLASNVKSYYENFFTVAEQNANSTNGLTEQFKALGIDTVPATREAFRALVESQDLTTEAGQEAAAALYGLAPAFAELVPSATEAASIMQVVTGSMTALGPAGLAAANGLAAAAGGLANLQGLVNSFTSGYFNDAEQRAIAINDVTADLNAAGLGYTTEQVAGADRSAIRAEVQRLGQNVSTAEGQAQYIAALRAAQKLDSTLPKLASAVESAAGGGGGGGGGAVDSINNAWKSIVDSLWGEVKRIKGLIEETGPTAYATAQQKFATATAAARAGSQEAAAALPGLSQALLKLAEENEATRLALKSMQGYVAQSLTVTATQLSNEQGLAIPQFDVGTNYVPRDMLAMIHEGEAIVPKAYNPMAGGNSNDSAMIAELQALRGTVSRLESRLANIDKSTASSEKMFKNVSENGKAVKTEAY